MAHPASPLTITRHPSMTGFLRLGRAGAHSGLRTRLRTRAGLHGSGLLLRRPPLALLKRLLPQLLRLRSPRCRFGHENLELSSLCVRFVRFGGLEDRAAEQKALRG